MLLPPLPRSLTSCVKQWYSQEPCGKGLVMHPRSLSSMQGDASDWEVCSADCNLDCVVWALCISNSPLETLQGLLGVKSGQPLPLPPVSPHLSYTYAVCLVLPLVAELDSSTMKTVLPAGLLSSFSCLRDGRRPQTAHFDILKNTTPP